MPIAVVHAASCASCAPGCRQRGKNLNLMNARGAEIALGGGGKAFSDNDGKSGEKDMEAHMSVLDSFSLKGRVALVTGAPACTASKSSRRSLRPRKDFIASRGLEAWKKVAGQERHRGLDVEALPFDQSNETAILRPARYDLRQGRAR